MKCVENLALFYKFPSYMHEIQIFVQLVMFIHCLDCLITEFKLNFIVAKDNLLNSIYTIAIKIFVIDDQLINSNFTILHHNTKI